MLYLALQDGFMDDAVTISANGAEIYSNDHVKTRLQIGFADSLELDVEQGKVEIKVSLPKKTLTKTIDLQVADKIYLGVSVARDDIEFRVSDEPFGYL